MTSDIFNDLVRHILFGASSIFKDESTLFREYIPEKLSRREKELKRISRDFRLILKDNENFPVNILISGLNEIQS